MPTEPALVFSTLLLALPQLLPIASAAHAQLLPSLSSRTPGSAPLPEDGPPISVNALRDPAYLPAEIGGIVGALLQGLVWWIFGAPNLPGTVSG